ncbi:ribulose-phosphate 3-epimerase [Paracoccus sp. (in: a-proteobacteria)]|uniref:ribulose-phosphate 3-epimerase n=1 Tax=Paracoccus sp. TaxID=267 RepID=UPI003A835E08
MPKPHDNWFDDLPHDRCIAEASMWSADLTDLGAGAERIAPIADMLHIDVADGVFAPAFLFFPDLVAALRARVALPLHVHLMVDDRILLAQAEQFAAAGADLISVHAESALAAEAMALIEDMGALPGLVLCVETPVAAARPLLEKARMLTLLGTAIGVKGQGLSPDAPDRLTEARQMLASQPGPRRILAADGGIRDHTVPGLLAAGAQTVVLGSLLFGDPDPAGRAAWLARQTLA